MNISEILFTVEAANPALAWVKVPNSLGQVLSLVKVAVQRWRVSATASLAAQCPRAQEPCARDSMIAPVFLSNQVLLTPPRCLCLRKLLNSTKKAQNCAMENYSLAIHGFSKFLYILWPYINTLIKSPYKTPLIIWIAVKPGCYRQIAHTEWLQ